MPVVVCLIVGLSAVAHAKHTDLPRVRPLDPSLTVIVDTGSHRSNTLHPLLDRLQSRDGVVYLQYGEVPRGLQGGLTFLTEAAGLRYVMVEVARELDALRLIAIVGHE